jgi:oligopeptide/dipeptide ABC transporter ATP-binding protein
MHPISESLPTAPSSAPLLEVKDLTVSYRMYDAPPVLALRGVNLRIGPGEILGLVGESGAGKTTLARAIMGVVHRPGAVERGQILFGGKDLTRQSEDQLGRLRGRAIAIIVANPRGELNPLLRIGEQLANVAQSHLRISLREARKHSMAMLRAVKIPDPERRFRAYPHELSGGMAQRVVIAAALICTPQLVISDDATSGLDVTVQIQILDLLRKLARERRTSMLYITRDVGVAANFCDRIAIVYRGEIVEEAPTNVFFSGPSHPYSNLLLAAFSHHSALWKRWSPELEACTEGPMTAPACLFADRCLLRQGRCFSEHPELRERAPGRFVRCHFPVERHRA